MLQKRVAIVYIELCQRQEYKESTLMLVTLKEGW